MLGSWRLARRPFISLLLTLSLQLLLLLTKNSRACAFTLGRATVAGLLPAEQSRTSLIQRSSSLKASPDGGAVGEESGETNEAEPEMIQTSKVRIDDGGSDLTDRFKYKVNALMGVFDPADADNDNERENGNILNAMLRFPLEYTFHVVGKTGGDCEAQEEFVEQVRNIAKTTTSTEEVVCTITPRGSKFTKVTIQVYVDNADVIASIYSQLEDLELSVMQF